MMFFSAMPVVLAAMMWDRFLLWLTIRMNLIPVPTVVLPEAVVPSRKSASTPSTVLIKSMYFWDRGKIKWIIIGVIVIGIAGAALGGKDNSVKRVNSSEDTVQKESSSKDSPTPESTGASVAQTDGQDAGDLTFKPGETAELNDVQVTLTGVTESKGSDYNKPTDGNIFVLAEFEIVNNSEKELAISSLISFDAYQDGYSTSLSLSALMENDSEHLDDSDVICLGKVIGKVEEDIMDKENF